MGLFSLVAGTANADEVKFSLLEKYNALGKYTNRITYYSYDTHSNALRTTRPEPGTAKASEGPFKVTEHRKLALGARELTGADQILFQGRTGNAWFLIVTDEYNSLNPLHWVSAISGHPIQVTKVLILVVRDDKLVVEKEVTGKGASYDWQASVLDE